MPRQGSLRVLADVAGSLAPRPQVDPAAREKALERWAQSLPGASPAMRAFLEYLAGLVARYPNPELECFPEQTTIAAALGTARRPKSIRAVKYLVARARAEGWIEVRPRAHGREKRINGYRLLPPWAPARQLAIREVQELPPAKGQSCPSPFLINTKTENAPAPTREGARAPSVGHPCPTEPAPPPEARLPAGQEREGSPSGSPCH